MYQDGTENAKKPLTYLALPTFARINRTLQTGWSAQALLYTEIHSYFFDLLSLKLIQ